MKTELETRRRVTELVREVFAAYESKDRGAIEGNLADDFVFTSPDDDHITRAQYFEKCWPNSEKARSIRIEKLFIEGNEAFVEYEREQNSGARFRNVERFVIEGDKIKSVDVYFGFDPETFAQSATATSGAGR